MAISKVIYQDSNEALVRAAYENGEMMCKLIETSTGIKSASSDLVSRELLEKYRPEDDHTACIHLIAMGNSDQYGFNRNGDYFAGDVLEKRAHTFVTNGHMFREHANKDPKKAIGRVKWAGYDPKGMQRVELIVHMDKDKAEEEYEMAKQGNALNFSMSCRVPNDRCSCCGNEAKTVSAYCDHLKSHMGQYMSGMDKYAFAYNDNPTFFDISKVKTPADRIARHLEYMFKDDSMSKAASVYGDSVVVPSAIAAMAEGINLDVFEIEEQAMLTKLAAAEEFANDASNYDRRNNDTRAYRTFNLGANILTEKLTSQELAKFASVQPGTLFRELNKRACVLSFPAFCQYLFQDANATDMPIVKSAACMLPGIFGEMVQKMMTMSPCTSMFAPSSSFMAEQDPKREDLVQNVMEDAERKFSIHGEPARKRITITIMMSGGAPQEKSASIAEIEGARQLAEVYGQYQIRTLCDLQDRMHDKENIDMVCDLIAGANKHLTI